MSNENKKNKKTLPIIYVWGLLCSLSSTDENTKNISLFNVIDAFGINKTILDQQKQKETPILIPIQYEIVLMFKRIVSLDISSEEILIDLKIKTISPGGKVLGELISPMKFLQGKENMRFVIKMPGLIFDVPGRYSNKIEIKLQEEKDFVQTSEIPFEVKISK